MRAGAIARPYSARGSHPFDTHEKKASPPRIGWGEPQPHWVADAHFSWYTPPLITVQLAPLAESGGFAA
jgi:hypothetical protein